MCYFDNLSLTNNQAEFVVELGKNFQRSWRLYHLLGTDLFINKRNQFYNACNRSSRGTPIIGLNRIARCLQSQLNSFYSGEIRPLAECILEDQKVKKAGMVN